MYPPKGWEDLGHQRTQNEQIDTLPLLAMMSVNPHPAFLACPFLAGLSSGAISRPLSESHALRVSQCTADTIGGGLGAVLRSSVLKLQRGPLRELPPLISFPGTAMEGAAEAMEGGDGEERDWKVWAQVVEVDWNLEKQCLGDEVTGLTAWV